MKKVRIILNISIIFLLFLFTFQSCKKNNNTETSYQAQANVASNHLLNQHNVVHLMMTYFKAITDETLLNNGNSIVDGGYLYLINNANNGIDIRFDFGEGLYDPFLRLRAGEILAKTDGDPFVEGTKTTFTFQNFSFRAIDSFPENPVTAQNIELEVTNASNNQFTFLLQIGSFTFTDTTLTKTVDLSGEMQIEWEKSADSPYFSDNEVIRFSPSTTQTNYDGIVSEITTQNAMQYNAVCSVFYGGSATIVIDGLSPGEGTLSYKTGEYCNTGADITLGEIPFRVGFTDWLLK